MQMNTYAVYIHIICTNTHVSVYPNLSEATPGQQSGFGLPALLMIPMVLTMLTMLMMLMMLVLLLMMLLLMMLLLLMMMMMMMMMM